MDGALDIECSQPSIFPNFHSIIKRADRIARELDASAKGRLDWVGGGDRDKIDPPRVLRARFSHFLSGALNREAVNSLPKTLYYSDYEEYLGYWNHFHLVQTKVPSDNFFFFQVNLTTLQYNQLVSGSWSDSIQL